MENPPSTIGGLLRGWRERRRLSQLALALEAGVSARHLSFIETGRAQPSREMVLHLSECLEVPLRERNALLLAAGFAPLYLERKLEDPELSAAREAVRLVIEGHGNAPALAVDRHWNLVMANAAIGPLIADASPTLLQPPVNVLRLSLHPEGLAPRIMNLAQWRAHLLARLSHQVEATADAELFALLRELEGYPLPNVEGRADADVQQGDAAGFVVPLRIELDGVMLTFLSTTTLFGTPLDVTLAELAIETFFPADAATATALTRLSSRT